jgi:phosphohistidine phosphatase
MMELYLVRHGIAVDGEPGLPEAFRPLAGKGRRRFQKTAKAFARLARKLDLVLTSPLVRAVQTAEILAGAADAGEVAVLQELDPSHGVPQLLEAVAMRAGDSKSVALVGHEPQLSAVLAALSGVAQDDLDVKKGVIVRIDVTALPQPDSVEPRWWLKPRAGTRIKGLPLKNQEIAETAEAGARNGHKAKAVPRKRKAKEGRAARSRRSARRKMAPKPGSAELPSATAEATP